MDLKTNDVLNENAGNIKFILTISTSVICTRFH